MQQHPLRHIVQSPAVHPKSCSLSDPSLSSAPLHYSLRPKCLLALHAGYRSIHFSLLKELFITSRKLPPISLAFLTIFRFTPEPMPNVLNFTERTENLQVSHYLPSVKLLTVTFSVKQETFHSNRHRLSNVAIYYACQNA